MLLSFTSMGNFWLFCKNFIVSFEWVVGESCWHKNNLGAFSRTCGIPCQLNFNQRDHREDSEFCCIIGNNNREVW